MRSASARRESRAPRRPCLFAAICASFAWRKVTPIAPGLGNKTCQNSPPRSRACQWYVRAASFRSSSCSQPFAALIYCRSWPRQACSLRQRRSQLRPMSSPWDDDVQSAARLIAARAHQRHQAAACSAPASRSSSRKAGRPIGGIPVTPACRRCSIFPSRKTSKTVTVLYPAPTRFPDGGGGNSIGYKGDRDLAAACRAAGCRQAGDARSQARLCGVREALRAGRGQRRASR